MIKRKKVRAIVFMLTAFALMIGIGVAAMIDNNTTAYAASPEFKIAVLSDTHYYSTSYMSDSEAFKTAMAQDRNLLAESGGILDAALAAIKADKPNVLLITGDLTAHGENQGHSEIAAKLIAFSEESGIKTYVINGNNDINNGNSLANLLPFRSSRYDVDEEISIAPAINQAEFRLLYNKLGYSDSIAAYSPAKVETKAGRLSYVVRPMDGYTIIAVDNCVYTADVTGTGTDTAEQGGAMSSELLAWVTAQAKAARDKGDAVIVFQHHSITSILPDDSMFDSLLTSGRDDIADTYAAAGIEVVLSSQTQANDISVFEIGDKKVYDVQNASITSYPGSYKMLEFAGGSKNKVKVDVKTNFLKKFTYTDPITGTSKTVDDLAEHSKEHTALTDQRFFSFLDEVVRASIDGILSTEEGISKFLVTKDENGKEVSVLEGLINGMIEDIDEEGTTIRDILHVKYNTIEERFELGLIGMGSGSDLLGITLYITIDSITKMLNDIMIEVEEQFIKDFSYLSQQLGVLSTDLMNYKIEGMNDSLGTIINAIYQNYLMGDETSLPSAEQLLSKFTPNSYLALSDIFEDVVWPVVMDSLDHIMSEINIDFTTLITGTSNPLLTPEIVVSLMKAFMGDLGLEFDASMLIQILGGSERAIEILERDYLDSDAKTELNATIHETISAFAIDQNYKEDKNTTITIAGKSSGGCGGCGTVNFSSFIFFGGLMALAACFILFSGKRRTAAVQN